MSAQSLGVVLVLLVLLAALASYLSWTANRLDRLHHRVDVSRESLRTQLARRMGTALEIAASGLLDPASAVLLADAAQSSLRAGQEDRGVRESELSQTLRAIFDADEVASLREEPEGQRLVAELGAACTRADLARRFLNDQVTSALTLRRRRRVRWFGLAGHAKEPTMADLDTAVPSALVGFGT